MTHDRVSSSQTLIYPLLPLSSQSIFVFLKKTTKKQNKNWLGTTTKPAKRAMQTTHAWGLLSSRLGNNDVKKRVESKSAKGKWIKKKSKKKRQKISGFYKEGPKVQ